MLIKAKRHSQLLYQPPLLSLLPYLHHPFILLFSLLLLLLFSLFFSFQLTHCLTVLPPHLNSPLLTPFPSFFTATFLLFLSPVTHFPSITCQRHTPSSLLHLTSRRPLSLIFPSFCASSSSFKSL